MIDKALPIDVKHDVPASRLAAVNQYGAFSRIAHTVPIEPEDESTLKRIGGGDIAAGIRRACELVRVCGLDT